MNVLNPLCRRVSDVALGFGMLFGAIDYGVLVDWAPNFPKIGIILCLMLRDLQPRILCGYFLMSALFSGYLLSFFLGSIMCAQLAARAIYDTDLREVDSGNIGISNFFRLSRSKSITFLVACAELGKGFLAVQYNGVEGAIWSVLGHIFSPWTATGGGKGVSVYLGAALAYNPYFGLAAVLSWIGMRMKGYDATTSSLCSVALFALLSQSAVFMISAVIIYFMHRRLKLNINIT